MGKLKEYYHDIICDGQITDIKDANDFFEWMGGKENADNLSPEELHSRIGDWKFEQEGRDASATELMNRI